MHTYWYLHGFRSHTNSQKVAAMRNYFAGSHVEAIEYSPHNPKIAAQTLTKAVQSLPFTQYTVFHKVAIDLRISSLYYHYSKSLN